MTMPPHSERVRALAELEVLHIQADYEVERRGNIYTGEESVTTREVASHQESVYDIRFAALRGEHHHVTEQYLGTAERKAGYWCDNCGSPIFEDDEAPYCLRDDADALLEAAAACGYRYVVIENEPGMGICARLLRHVLAGSDLTARHLSDVVGPYAGTPAEALSAALYVAEIGSE